jgi:hypothetical protein
MTMITITEVLQRARELGIQCAIQTFRKYVDLGLIPPVKIPGRGNVLYFPDDTSERLYVLLVLTRHDGISLSALVKQGFGKWSPGKAGAMPLIILADMTWAMAKQANWPPLNVPWWGRNLTPAALVVAFRYKKQIKAVFSKIEAMRADQKAPVRRRRGKERK